MSRQVLVADDDPDIVDSMAILLEMSGCEVRKARNGHEAVAAAELYRPDVVLLDPAMARLDGVDACRRIREQPWGRDIVLIAVTGRGDFHESTAVGFDAHLIKPVRSSALHQLLDGIFDQRR